VWLADLAGFRNGLGGLQLQMEEQRDLRSDNTDRLSDGKVQLLKDYGVKYYNIEIRPSEDLKKM